MARHIDPSSIPIHLRQPFFVDTKEPIAPIKIEELKAEEELAKTPKEMERIKRQQEEQDSLDKMEQYQSGVLKRNQADGTGSVKAQLEKAKLELANLQRLRETQEREISDGKKKADFYVRKNKLLFFNNPEYGYLGRHGKWEPNPHQKELLNAFASARYKTLYAVGANRIGKTFIEIIMAASLITGKFPWEPEDRKGWIWDRYGWSDSLPIRGRIIGQDWEKHIKTVIIPDMKELFPEEWNMKIKKNTIGVEAFWTHPETGGTIEIMSNNSESSLFEGWHGHFILWDEPPSRDNRIASARGLVDYNGIEGFFMTLLKEAWVDKEVINATLDNGELDPTVFGVKAEITANIGFGLDEKGIKNFASKLTPEEKEARLKGVPAYKAGLVLNIDRQKHVIKPFRIPSHWPIDVHIDIGVSKPHDIIYVATDTKGFKYVCFEENLRGDGIIIADSIIKKQQRYNLRLNRIICDPLAKADQNNENSTYDKIDMHLNKFMCPFTDEAYYLETGSKDKEDGVRRINELLETVNGIPALFFFSDCARAISQCMNLLRDVTGLITKKDDDMFEGLYRIMLLDTEYVDISREVNDYDPNIGLTRNSATGY